MTSSLISDFPGENRKGERRERLDVMKVQLEFTAVVKC